VKDWLVGSRYQGRGRTSGFYTDSTIPSVIVCSSCGSRGGCRLGSGGSSDGLGSNGCGRFRTEAGSGLESDHACRIKLRRQRQTQIRVGWRQRRNRIGRRRSTRTWDGRLGNGDGRLGYGTLLAPWHPWQMGYTLPSYVMIEHQPIQLPCQDGWQVMRPNCRVWIAKEATNIIMLDAAQY
jgi:hypothetical protein